MTLFRKDTMQIVMDEREATLPLTEKQEGSVQTLTPLICHFLTRYCNDKKRRRILCELIQTERSYVNSLEELIEVYYKPLEKSIAQKEGLIDLESLNTLLGDFDQICDIHKNIILRAMNKSYDELQQPFPSHEAFLRIPRVFIEVYPRLSQIYTTFLANNSQSDVILTKLKKNRKFRNFLKEAIFDPKAKGQEIDDFLILPTQRMAAYKLLFERVIKNFPKETHQNEHDQYINARDQLVKIGLMMNSEGNDQQAQKELLSVAEMIGKVPPTIDIMKPGRKFYGMFNCARLQLSITKYQIFVMNDVIIITSRDEWSVFSATKISFVELIPLVHLNFTKIEVPQYKIYENNAFIMDSNTYQGEYFFIALNSIERDNIVFKLHKLKKHILDRIEKMKDEGMTFITKNMQYIHDSYFKPKASMTRVEAIKTLV